MSPGRMTSADAYRDLRTGESLPLRFTHIHRADRQRILPIILNNMNILTTL
jgi:hypothetical protein